MNAKYVPIELDKQRSLRVTMNALYRFEQKTGKSVFDVKQMQELTASDTLTLLWALLLHEDRDLTVEAVGDMVDGANFVAVVQRVSEAMNDLSGGSAPPTEKGPLA